MNTNNIKKNNTTPYMQTGIGSFTDTLINQCIYELNKKETKEKVYNKILTPMIDEINKKIYPYFMGFSLAIITILILIIIMFMFIIKNQIKFSTN